MPDMFSGDCLTPYSTAAKTVDIDNYTLTTGVLLAVKFLAGKESTVPAHPTLNVSNTGAIPIVLETDEIEFIPGGNMLYLFTYDGEGYNIIGYNSEDNPDGVSKWYAGTHITGTSTTETVFPQSEVDNAVVGDMYLNTSTNNVYQCTFAGVPAIAKWKYIANIEGAPGFSPRATVTKSGSTATITITDEEGTTSETVSDGEDGQDGQDGYSPSATVTKSGDTATITITDVNGTTTESVSDGTDGQDGQDGQDGYSPTATVSKSGDTATITITDVNGTTTETVSDGQDGQDGQPGADGDDGATIWTATANPTTPNYTFNISDLTGQSGRTPQVGDLVVRSYYRYTITSVSSTTVLTGTRTSIRGAAGADGQMLYATCSTAASTAAKVATLEAGTLTLVKGASVAVTFENENTSTNPTLNVANTGAKPIIAIGENLTDLSAYNWVARATVIFVYDGTNWQMDGTSSLSKAESAQQQADNANTNITELGLYVNGGAATEVSTEDYNEEEVIVDTSIFYEHVSGQFGTYTFTYNGSVWKLNGTTVDLNDYGVYLHADPSTNDQITVNLTEVVGTIQTIDDRFDELSDLVDTNADTAASDLASARNDLESSIDITNQHVSYITNELAILTDRTQSIGFNELYGLILYAIGANDNTGFKLQLSPNAINFINGQIGNSSDILAYMSGNNLNINNAIVNQRLRFGNFAFIPRTNGNMCLKYLG